MYAVTGPLANTSAKPSVASDTMPRQVSSSKRSFMGVSDAVLRAACGAAGPLSAPGERRTKNDLLYQPMVISRRALLKGLVAGGIGTVTAAGAYGYVNGRRLLELTRVT